MITAKRARRSSLIKMLYSRLGYSGGVNASSRRFQNKKISVVLAFAPLANRRVGSRAGKGLTIFRWSWCRASRGRSDGRAFPCHGAEKRCCWERTESRACFLCWTAAGTSAAGAVLVLGQAWGLGMIATARFGESSSLTRAAAGNKYVRWAQLFSTSIWVAFRKQRRLCRRTFGRTLKRGRDRSPSMPVTADVIIKLHRPGRRAPLLWRSGATA